VTILVQSLMDIAPDYDAIVFDQWGVLHDGSAPYPGAVNCLKSLHNGGHRLAVLSNSGKRASQNRDRISKMGFPWSLFECVMTSGEALWQDINSRTVSARTFFPVERSVGDAVKWAQGLNVALTNKISSAEAILLMGLPDNSKLEDYQPLIQDWLDLDLPIYCSNPDRASPRADGLVISPGALAHTYLEMGGKVHFYGKPHAPVFDSLQNALGVQKLLMIGDSIEHDIAGAQGVGWDNILVQSGLYKDRFATENPSLIIQEIIAEKACAAPTFRIESVQ